MNIKMNHYGAGFPLVFFHGWGFDNQIWMPLVPQLMMHYELILVDLPGFGQTPMMSWDEFKGQLLSQLPEQFAVIGWSMGGLYSTRIALEAPERVTCLLNITSSPKFLLEGDWPGISKEVFTTFYQSLLRDTRATLNEFIELNTSKNKFPSIHSLLPSSEGLESGLETLATWDFREQLKSFNKPVYYFFGRLDPIVPVKTMHTMQEQYPEFYYKLFHRAAHMPFLSHMDLFIDEIREFIK